MEKTDEIRLEMKRIVESGLLSEVEAEERFYTLKKWNLLDITILAIFKAMNGDFDPKFEKSVVVSSVLSEFFNKPAYEFSVNEKMDASDLIGSAELTGRNIELEKITDRFFDASDINEEDGYFPEFNGEEMEMLESYIKETQKREFGFWRSWGNTS